jgi:hypothetical protein
MQWRLIRDDAARGAWNMAVDEAMMLHQSRTSTRDGTMRSMAGIRRAFRWVVFQKWEEVWMNYLLSMWCAVPRGRAVVASS